MSHKQNLKRRGDVRFASDVGSIATHTSWPCRGPEPDHIPHEVVSVEKEKNTTEKKQKHCKLKTWKFDFLENGNGKLEARQMTNCKNGKLTKK